MVLACIVALASSPARAQSGPANLPEEPAESSPPQAFNFFAHYGDLDQVYDPSVGSADRMASYPAADGGQWCSSRSTPNGTQRRDTDNPSEREPGRAHFRLTGYPPFDPGSVEHCVVRVDLLYEPFDRSMHPDKQDRVSFFFRETCLDFGGFEFTSAVREALQAAGQDRRQWMAVHMDLINLTLEAQEIDALGNPIPGRRYERLVVRPLLERSAPDRVRFDKDEVGKVLEEASSGSLEGLVQWSGKISYASISGRARPQSRTRVLLPETLEDFRGRLLSGAANHLSEELDLVVGLESLSDTLAHVSEVTVVYGVGAGLVRALNDPARPSPEGTLRFRGSSPGVVMGTYTLSVLDPAGGASLRVDSGQLSNSGFRPTIRTVPVPQLSKYIDSAGKIRVRFAHRNSFKAIAPGSATLLEHLVPAMNPRVNIDQLRLTVEADP